MALAGARWRTRWEARRAWVRFFSFVRGGRARARAPPSSPPSLHLFAAVVDAVVAPLLHRAAAPTAAVTPAADGVAPTAEEQAAACRALEGLCLVSDAARLDAVAAGAPAALAARLADAVAAAPAAADAAAPPLFAAAGAVLLAGPVAVATFDDSGGVAAAGRAVARGGAARAASAAAAAFVRLLLLHVVPAVGGDADAVRSSLDGVLGPGAADALAAAAGGKE